MSMGEVRSVLTEKGGKPSSSMLGEGRSRESSSIGSDVAILSFFDWGRRSDSISMSLLLALLRGGRGEGEKGRRGKGGEEGRRGDEGREGGRGRGRTEGGKERGEEGERKEGERVFCHKV